MHNGIPLTVGMRVRWHTPMNDEERAQIFEVLEVRGDRVLVTSTDPAFDAWRIRPNWVYSMADLVPELGA